MKTFHKLSLGLMAASLTACGGAGTTGSVPSASPTISAQFVDAPVQNLQYSSLSNSGVTDANGGFRCKLNEEVSFNIGALNLGTSICQRIVTPQTLAATVNKAPAPQTTTSASGVVTSTGAVNQTTVAATAPANDPAVVNRVRLLLTLDTDGDATNGIQLPSTDEQKNVTLNQIDFKDTTSFDNDAVTVVQAMPSVSNQSITDPVTAESHFNDTLTNTIPGITATPATPNAQPVNIGQYYDDNTGHFDEDSLETEHNEFNESENENEGNESAG